MDTTMGTVVSCKCTCRIRWVRLLHKRFRRVRREKCVCAVTAGRSEGTVGGGKGQACLMPGCPVVLCVTCSTNSQHDKHELNS